jgi:DNA-binding XRE family transcriptional regulator
MRNRSLPGRHITDRQMRLYMNFRQAETPTIAAAKAGLSTATAYRIEQDRPSPSGGTAAALVIPLNAHFVALYAIAPGDPRRPATDD